jgi:hypothetical protein
MRRSNRTVSQKGLPVRVKSLFHDTNPIVSKRLERIHSNPNVYFIRNFLTESELTHLDCICTNRCAIFQNSFVEDDNNREIISTERTSTYTFLNKAQDSVIRNIEARATAMAGMSPQHCEPLQIVSYTQGQKFETHHDAGTLLDDDNVELVLPRRLVTIFVYLNTLPDGQGHTEFPKLNISIRPQRGCAVFFCNVCSDGTVDVRTVHRAAPVEGELQKYGMNIWLCDQSFQELALAEKGKQESRADRTDLYSRAKLAGKTALQQAEQHSLAWNQCQYQVKSDDKKEEHKDHTSCVVVENVVHNLYPSTSAVNDLLPTAQGQDDRSLSSAVAVTDVVMLQMSEQSQKRQRL